MTDHIEISPAEAQQLGCLRGPLTDWLALSRDVMLALDLVGVHAARLPILLRQTPSAYLAAVRSRLAGLLAVLDEELDGRDLVEDPNMSALIEARSDKVRATAEERLDTWLRGDDPDRVAVSESEDAKQTPPTGFYL